MIVVIEATITKIKSNAVERNSHHIAGYSMDCVMCSRSQCKSPFNCRSVSNLASATFRHFVKARSELDLNLPACQLTPHRFTCGHPVNFTCSSAVADIPLQVSAADGVEETIISSKCPLQICRHSQIRVQ